MEGITEKIMLKMKSEEFVPSRFRAEGMVTIKGKEIPYEVISEDNVLNGENGAPAGSVFTYSYFRKDVTEEERKIRPVVFAFNGGPGSSSLWLHWGLLAPKAIRFENPTEPQQNPPYELKNNDECLLDICDVVLIDPVECGYGILLDPAAGTEFFGCDQDAASLALVIEDWLIRNDRMNAPKYIMGESYGTMRACLLANALMGGPTFPGKRDVGIAVSGMIFMGTILAVDASLHPAMDASIENCVLHLPTLAATRYYHEPVEGKTAEEFVEEAYRFTADTYLRAIYLGNRLPEREKAEVIAKLAYFTGLDKEYFQANGLKITTQAYPKAYSDKTGKFVGIYDGRYTMPPLGTLQVPDPVADDGAMGKYTAFYTGVMSGPGKESLGITLNRPYKAINFDVNGKWNYQMMRSSLSSLEEVIRRNPKFRLLVANGMYDLCTPMGAARYAMSQIRSTPGQIEIKDYPSGHMTYVGETSLAMLNEDIRTFITN